MKKTLIITAVLAALMLAGCTAVNTTQTEAAPAAEKSTTVKFGAAYTYNDGVTITVSAPEEFQPGEHAYGADQEHVVKFTITIDNGSSEALEPVVFTHVKSSGTKATQVYDVDNGIDADPQEVIPKGSSITWIEAYSVADPTAPLILTTSPNMHDYTELTFTNVK